MVNSEASNVRTPDLQRRRITSSPLSARIHASTTQCTCTANCVIRADTIEQRLHVRACVAWLLLVATTALLSAAGATAQGCANATFPAGRSFERCNTLPVLGASLHWTYHAANGTAELAFRAPSSSSGWVAWGINTDGVGMVGSSVFMAVQDVGGAVTAFTTVLESTAPRLVNETLKFDVPVPPTAEYAAGAYTIYTTVALPRNETVQNTVWQAGRLSGPAILPHPTSGPNLLSVKRQDFLSG